MTPYEPIPINGERTIGALMEMVQESDQRGHERHAETMREMGDVKTRVTSVEEECKRRPELCALKWKLADCEPAWSGRERRNGEAAEANGDRRTWVMWGVGRKVGAVLLSLAVAALITVINVVINLAWFGTP